MESLMSDDFRDKLGEFIDEYITCSDGSSIPRNVPYFRDALKLMITDGFFHNKEEIRKKCLREKLIIIPNFLFDEVS